LRAYRSAVISGLFLSGACLLSAQSLYVKPVKVLGDPNFIGTAGNPGAYDSTGPNVVEGKELYSPFGIALDTSVTPPIVYIADTNNNRVLGYQYATQLTAGAPADVILGQPDRFSTVAKGPGTSLSTGLRSPTGLVVDAGGNLYVADSGNNRILRYPKPMSQPAGYQFPDLIIGQTSFSSAAGNSGGLSATSLALTGNFFSRTGIALDGNGNLWVTDTGNNRVLRYPAASLKANQNGPTADVVLGQPDFITNAGAGSRVIKTGLASPTGIAIDSKGRILVADGLARVLVYAAGSTTNAPAVRIAGVSVNAQGQPNSTVPTPVNLTSATAVSTNGVDVFVADPSSNRVVLYGTVDSWQVESAQFSPNSIGVVGQKLSTDSKANQGGEPNASTLSSPIDMTYAGSELFVADSANNRVTVFPSADSGTGPAATRVIGQFDFPDKAPNLAEGKEFYLSGSVSSGASGTAVLDLKATPQHLYVADTLNNRVLGFKDFRNWKPGQKADLVIGQPDFSRTTVNYPSNQGGSPNGQGLNSPSSLVLDSAGNLYVADTFNARVLRFPAPFSSGQAVLESADLVIGQADFSSSVTDPTERTLSAPVSIALSQAGFDASQTSSGYLLVADPNQNRVLVFPKPFTSGMSATKVIGQYSFNSALTSNDSAHLASPRAVAMDPNDRVLVADAGNGRIQGFDTVQNLPAFNAAAAFSITAGLSTPYGLGMGSNGQFWVADPGRNSLIHFPGIDQLPLNNYSSDATLPVLSPRSAFVDTFNNLLTTDGINRVLYFVPGLAPVNAANYISGRPLAPGTFAAVFPAAKGNTLAGATDSATAFPLPATLADTQVLVNGNPNPLLFVSAGQINLPLSMNLPTGGTVDMQVVSASTGQIFGTAEIPMSTASPGIFTSNGSGTGTAAAINVTDSTVNSSHAPVARGDYISLFGTGQGIVPNAPADGQPATGPVPTATHPQILLGTGTAGVYAAVPDANIQYSGLAPSLAGVWQINLQIPTTAPTGNAVPLKILMNSVPSDNPAAPSQVAVTLAIK
jgi:uncharacterized protein (TIGR03437 family)